MKKIVVLLFASLVFSGLACASLIPSLDAVPTVGPNYTWSYTLTVASDEQLNPAAASFQKCATCPSGTFFTIYDIAQYVSGSATQTATGWTNQVQFVGITPIPQGGNSVIPADSPNLINVTWFYTGPPSPAAQSAASLILPGFSFQSTSNVPVAGVSAYSGTKFSDPTLVDIGVNGVRVPGASNTVPEPASMLLIGGGLVGLALLRRKLT